MKLINIVLSGTFEDLKTFFEENKDIDIDFQTKDGYTALIIACKERYIEKAKLLISKGADVNIQASDGRTALFEISFYKEPELVELLLDNGADPNIPDKNWNDIPIFACACSEDNLEVFEILANCSNLEHKNKIGSTILFYTVVNRKVKLVKNLLSKNVDVNTTNITGYTPLSICKMADETEILSQFKNTYKILEEMLQEKNAIVGRNLFIDMFKHMKGKN
jgi:ankyrin repeat protein